MINLFQYIVIIYLFLVIINPIICLFYLQGNNNTGVANIQEVPAPNPMYIADATQAAATTSTAQQEVTGGVQNIPPMSQDVEHIYN